jgi:hypothetical protein
MTARERDGFRQALRSLATPRVVDLTFRASLSWPETHWYEPESFEDVAAQDAIRSARSQGLPDLIEDSSAVGRLAVLLRKRR